MQIYAAGPARRSRQIGSDVVAIAAIIVSVTLGVIVAGLIRTLGAVGRSVEDAGTSLHDRLAGAAHALGGIPLVGDAASAPLRDAGGAGTTLADAGRQQQAVIGHLALVVGLLVALLPIAFILVLWLRPRVAFAREAAEARRLSTTDGGLQLLAFRALATGDTAALMRITPNPVAAWSAGDALEQRLLAEFALREAGVAR